METLFNLVPIAAMIPQIIILVAAVRYVSRHSTAEGVMLLTGTIIILIKIIFYFMLIPALIDDFSLITPQQGFMITNTTGTIGWFTFAVGFFLLMHKIPKRKV